MKLHHLRILSDYQTYRPGRIEASSSTVYYIMYKIILLCYVKMPIVITTNNSSLVMFLFHCRFPSKSRRLIRCRRDTRGDERKQSLASRLSQVVFKNGPKTVLVKQCTKCILLFCSFKLCTLNSQSRLFASRACTYFVKNIIVLDFVVSLPPAASSLMCFNKKKKMIIKNTNR
ncbi:hypothetical protein AGLY_006457 [Aphis glycines]|uniref:Uncharacterized protein n=1 Tax=Aphis glycines TaxID=307491 RepID=A0A6G0TR75_APHGL|nr:hypothetical protein AGLY_006457 [Aphis glycines]